MCCSENFTYMIECKAHSAMATRNCGTTVSCPSDFQIGIQLYVEYPIDTAVYRHCIPGTVYQALYVLYTTAQRLLFVLCIGGIMQQTAHNESLYSGCCLQPYYVLLFAGGCMVL